jgi:hypothetical protein
MRSYICGDLGASKILMAQAVLEEASAIHSFSPSNLPEIFNINIVDVGNMEISELIHLFKGNFTKDILMGTSFPDKKEIDLIQEVKKSIGLRVTSFLDAPINIVNRFITSDNKIVFPDCIVVFDKKAREKAIAKGVPADIIELRNNPYIKFLKQWQPKETEGEFQSRLELCKEWKTAIFAPDPLSITGLREVYGLDEYQLSNMFAKALSQSELKNMNWLLKLHPKQEKQDLIEKVFRDHLINIHVISNKDMLQALHFSDVIVGMNSNILKEAMALDCSVVRFLPLIKCLDEEFERQMPKPKKTAKEVLKSIESILA